MEPDESKVKLILKRLFGEGNIITSILLIIFGIFLIAAAMFGDWDGIRTGVGFPGLGSIWFFGGLFIFIGVGILVINLIKAVMVLIGRDETGPMARPMTEPVMLVLSEEPLLPLPFTFKVTQEHLDQGDRNSATLNPVALALRQAIETDYPRLKITYLSVNAYSTHLGVEDLTGESAHEVFRNRTLVAIYIEGFSKSGYSPAQPEVFEILPGNEIRLISAE